MEDYKKLSAPPTFRKTIILFRIIQFTFMICIICTWIKCKMEY